MTFDFNAMLDLPNASVGEKVAYRFWRYVYRGLPDDQHIRLMSWVPDMVWHPGQVVEGSSPDIEEQGIHGFKTEEDMLKSFDQNFGHMVIRSQVSGCDGVVFGVVKLWGIVWEHDKGYRAQYAQPAMFKYALGLHCEAALRDLRQLHELPASTRMNLI
jgi:hypothetical protein